MCSLKIFPDAKINNKNIGRKYKYEKKQNAFL